MAFELKLGESLPKGILRLAQEQMDTLLEEVSKEPKGSRDEAVHEARKILKKLRALMRLVRPKIGETTFREENTCFRDTARPLTQVRDARILIETLDKLTEHFKEHVGSRSFAAARKDLQADLRGVRTRVLDEYHAFAVVAEAVQQARKRITGWAAVADRWSSLGKGVDAVYRQAREAFDEAAADPTVEKLHEWRKQAKYLRYQLELLQPLWPARMEELVEETDQMGKLLGDDHDLAVLRQMLIEQPERFGHEADGEFLLALIDRRRNERQQEALLLGQRFFQDRPRDLAGRLKGYWKSWQGQANAPAEEPHPLV